MEFPSPTETFVSSRVKSLADLGVEVDLFALRPEHKKAREMAVARGVNRVRCNSNSAWSSLRGAAIALIRPVLLFRYLRWLITATYAQRSTFWRGLVLTPRAFDVLFQLERRPPEVIHAEWGHYPSLVLWLVQARLPSVATSIALNAGDLAMEYGGSIVVARNADLIRTHTSANIPHVSKFIGVDKSRVSLIYNGVDVARVEEVLATVPKIPGRVVTVARLVPQKRTDMVLKVFAACASKVPNAELRVFGEGPERARLERQAQALGLADRVAFYGHVGHDRVLTELAEAEALLLLSESPGERLPNVVKEGMAARCVCITTKSTGIEELVSDGVTGFVVDFGDVRAASNALGWALANRDEAVRMGLRAHMHVAEHFDHLENVRRFVDLWKECRHKALVRRRPVYQGGATRVP